MSHSPPRASIDNEDYSAGWTALFDLLYSGGSLSGRERNCCFVNPGTKPFVDISAVAGFDFADDGRAMATVDWDHDGRIDVWTMNRSAPRLRFLRNVSRTDNRFVTFDLEGTLCNRDAIGARVIVHLDDGRNLSQSVTAGAGYLSQSTKSVHFGLGSVAEIKSVSVAWPLPGSPPEVFTAIQPDRRYKLVQGTGTASLVGGSADRKLDLRPGEVQIEALSDQNRIVLAGRVPVFPVEYEDANGRAATLSTGGRPTLINLWASWCEPCINEISTMAASSELNQRVKIILLSGDEPKDRQAALSVLDQTQWQGQNGFATSSTLDYFDILQKSLLSHKLPLPIPTSFLIDHNGNLAAIYKGAVDIEQLINDVQLCQANDQAILSAAVPFPGQWFEMPNVAAHSLIAIATNLTKQGNPDLASKYLSSITDRIDPQPLAEEAEARMTLAGAQLNLASEFYQQGNVQKAIDLVQEAIRFAPRFAKAHFNLGVIHQEQGQISAAIESFENALNADPNHAYSNFNLATIYEKTKPELARNFYERAIATSPEFTQARYNLGLLLLKTGSVESAKEHFESILNSDIHADSHYQLGNIAIKNNNTALAISEFEKAVSINQRHTDAMTNLAALLFSKKQFNQATEYLGKVARIKQDQALAQFNYGIALLQNENHHEAIRQFRKTLEIEPDHPAALLRLAQALTVNPDASQQELKEAIELANESSRRQPNTGAAAETIIQQAHARLNN